MKGASVDFAFIALSVFAIITVFWFARAGQSRLPLRGYLEPSITPMMSLMLIGAMFVCGSTGNLFAQGRGAADTADQLVWTYGFIILAQLPVVCAYVFLRKHLGSRHILTTSLIALLVFAPAAHVIASVVHIIFIRLGIEIELDFGHSTLLFFTATSWDQSIWTLFLCTTLGAAVVEEVMYRGLLLPTLVTFIGGRSMWQAMVLTSLIFALMHIGPAQPSAIVGLFVFSLGLCWARIKSGGILAPIIIHAIFNAINIALV